MKLSAAVVVPAVILVASRAVTVTVTAGSLLIDPGSGKHPTPVRLPSIHILSVSDSRTRRLFLPAVVDVVYHHHEGFQDEG